MTFKTKLTEMLVENGLFDTQAEKVMAALITSPASDSMKDRWNDDVEGYPDVMLPVLWMGAKREALAFIDKEIPQHWARGMFP